MIWWLFFPLEVRHDGELSPPGSYTNGRDNSSDQLNDLFDFSKVPDVDPATRTRMGSKSPQFRYLVGWFGHPEKRDGI